MRPSPDKIPDQRDEREPDKHGCGICERESDLYEFVVMARRGPQTLAMRDLQFMVV
jgi:hypothetical protein